MSADAWELALAAIGMALRLCEVAFLILSANSLLLRSCGMKKQLKWPDVDGRLLFL